MRKVARNDSFPMIRSTMMGPIIRALETSNVDCDAVLAEFGMSRRLLANPYEILPLGRYVAAFERIAQVLDEPSLGLRLGSELQLTELGPAGLIFLASPTLSIAIRNFLRALASWQTATVCELLSEGEWQTWTYRVSDSGIWPRQQDAEYTLSTMCSMIRSVLGSAWAPVEVHFEHAAPVNSLPYARIFRTVVRFQQPINKVILRQQELNAPLRSANNQLARLMERHAADLIAKDALPYGLVDQVRDFVRRRLALEKLGVDEIASNLGLSHRSLQRYLSAEGTSVRQILREERQQSVDSLSGRGGLTNAEIARAVGYADATVLWRAKRNWHKD